MRSELSLFFAAQLIGLSAHAEQVSVRTAWGEQKTGELVEGVRGDYVLLRYPSKREELVQWMSIHSMARAGYPFASKRAFELPWSMRPTLGVQLGLGGIGADLFGPYLSTGATLGVSAGVSLARWVSLIGLYEWTSHSYDIRNTGAPAGRSHFVGIGARMRANDATGSSGLFFQPVFGLRQTAYSFSQEDGNGNPSSTPGRRMTERASLLGWELRAGLGIAFTASRTTTVDLYLSPGIGSFFRYSDTLGCATFRFGACGGGYKFSYASLAFMMGVSWN